MQIAVFQEYINNQKTLTEYYKLKSEEQVTLFETQRTEINAQAESLKVANSKLLELGELKEGLTSMIVHDFKIPLHNIINCPEDIDSGSQLQLIKQSGKNILNLVMNILDVYKYEKSGMELILEDIHINGLIQRVLGQIELLAKQKNLSIYFDLPSNLVIYADYGIIERVFINLLTNAIKYTPTNGKININFKQTNDNQFRFEVIDTGPGIPPEKKELVFAKFGQVVAKKTGEIRSTGLGLTFCKIAVEAHNGIIGFENLESEGAMFWFTIPIINHENIDFEKKQIGEISNKALENIKKLSEGSKEYLKPFVQSLKEIEIYQISKIRQVLKQITPNDIDILIWKDLIIDAVYSNNQGLYSKLLEFDN